MDLYQMGYASFKDGMQEHQIKSQPPLFRAGWRAAEVDFRNRNSGATSVKNARVQKQEKVPFELKWNDINSVLNYHYWNILMRKEELSVLTTAMKNVIWKNKDKITSYKKLIDTVRTMWEGILQLGWDEGILNKDDLAQYNFVPKNKTKQKETTTNEA